MSPVCPVCGGGSFRVTETATEVTHTCRKCGYSETRPKGTS